MPAAPRARALDRLLSCPVAGARAGAPPRAGVRRARRRGAPRARLSGCHAPAPRQARGWPRGQRGRKPACAALLPPAGARQRWCGGPGAGRATCGWHCVEPGGVRASRSRLVRRPRLLAGGQAARAARATRPQVRHPPPNARLWGRPGSPWPGPCVRVACGRPRCAPARARRGDALGRLFLPRGLRARPRRGRPRAHGCPLGGGRFLN